MKGTRPDIGTGIEGKRNRGTDGWEPGEGQERGQGDTDRDRAVVITTGTGTGVEGQGQLQRDRNSKRDSVTGRGTMTGGIGNE